MSYNSQEYQSQITLSSAKASPRRLEIYLQVIRIASQNTIALPRVQLDGRRLPVFLSWEFRLELTEPIIRFCGRIVN